MKEDFERGKFDKKRNFQKSKKLVKLVAYGVLIYKLHNSVKLTCQMVALK